VHKNSSKEDNYLPHNTIVVNATVHSNLIGLRVDTGNWVTEERLRLLSGAVYGNSSSGVEAQSRAVVLLGGQVRLQAYTLATRTFFILVAWVCVAIVLLIAFMKPTRILFRLVVNGAAEIMQD